MCASPTRSANLRRLKDLTRVLGLNLTAGFRFASWLFAPQVHRLRALLLDAEKHGAEVVCGGGTAEDSSRYVAPTVIKCGLDSPLMQVRHGSSCHGHTLQ